MSASEAKNEIVVYQPNGSVRLEVMLRQDTVWLNRQQIARLFGRDVKTIGKHIANALQEELAPIAEDTDRLVAKFATTAVAESPTVAKFATVQKEGSREVVRQVEYYSLEVITSVGYRVKSSEGVMFRRWANRVLKNYLLRGYAVNERLNLLEDKVDRRLAKTERDVIELKEQVGFFVKTALPPVEGVLFEGQIKDAYDVALKIVRSARKSLVLIDNWIDDTVLTMLDKRGAGVACTVYTKHYSKRLALDVRRHNEQYAPITVKPYRGAHDRFLIADSAVYHVGASLKDLGKSLFAFSRLVTPASTILAQVGDISSR